MAKAAGAAAAMLAAPVVAVPVAKKAGHVAHKAGSLVGKGKKVAGQASNVMDSATDVKQAVSSHSSTLGKVGGVISAVKGGEGGGTKPKLSHLIEQHTDIAVPRSVVYNQWTQLEMFPTITKGIESVEQQSDEKSKWTSKIGPSRRTWTGNVVEQIPDERIAWKSEGGAQIQGVVTFHSLDVDLTRVLLQMEYKPTGAVEWVGNTLRIQRRRAKRDLRLFKHFLELRGEETGSWRGRVDEDQKLEPLFAGQGRVRGGQGSDRGGDKSGGRTTSGGSSRSSKASGSSGGGSRRSGSGSGGSGSGGSRRSGSSGSSNGGGSRRRPSGPARSSNGRSSNGRSSNGSGGSNGGSRSRAGTRRPAGSTRKST
jgi:uncharacterized membrane protein